MFRVSPLTINSCVGRREAASLLEVPSPKFLTQKGEEKGPSEPRKKKV